MNQNGTSDGGPAQGLVRIGKEGIETGDDSVIDAYFARDFVFHGPGGDMNLEQLKSLWAAFRTAFTGLTITREHIVAEGTMLAARSTFSGVFERPYTHSPVGVVQPTGRRVSFEVINIFRYDEAGRLAEEWAQLDNLGLLQQLGVNLR